MRFKSLCSEVRRPIYKMHRHSHLQKHSPGMLQIPACAHVEFLEMEIGVYFFLPPAALAAAASFFFSSACFFLNSMSSSVCSFFPLEAFFEMTAFCALLEVPTGMVTGVKVEICYVSAKGRPKLL